MRLAKQLNLTDVKRKPHNITLECDVYVVKLDVMFRSYGHFTLDLIASGIGSDEAIFLIDQVNSNLWSRSFRK